MKGYEDYFKSMNDEEWEKFAVDVLRQCGFSIIKEAAFGPDGGKDAIVEKDNIIYIVSCKHYIGSGSHVGVSDETSISDRILHHGANGFIGFYSTGITNSLQDRLDGLSNRGFTYIILDKGEISNIMPCMEQRITFKYGADKNKYYMNVSRSEYRRLDCIGCGRDILSDSMIPLSIIGLAHTKENKLGYVFGCKMCLSSIALEETVEVSQILHLEELNAWNSYVEQITKNENLMEGFWKYKAMVDSRINQRIFPSNYGTWL